MAEALRSRDIAVDMVKPGPDLLPWMPRDLAGVVQKELEANAVGLHPGHTIKAIEKAESQLTIVCENKNLTAEMVLVAIGIHPNSELVKDAGLELGPGGAITVNRRLQTSDEMVYAAGDCADAIHVVTGEKTWIPLALRANRAGWAVADNVCGKITELDGVAGTAVFKFSTWKWPAAGLTNKRRKRPVSTRLR